MQSLTNDFSSGTFATCSDVDENQKNIHVNEKKVPDYKDKKLPMNEKNQPNEDSSSSSNSTEECSFECEVDSFLSTFPGSPWNRTFIDIPSFVPEDYDYTRSTEHTYARAPSSSSSSSSSSLQSNYNKNIRNDNNNNNNNNSIHNNDNKEQGQGLGETEASSFPGVREDSFPPVREERSFPGKGSEKEHSIPTKERSFPVREAVSVNKDGDVMRLLLKPDSVNKNGNSNGNNDGKNGNSKGMNGHSNGHRSGCSNGSDNDHCNGSSIGDCSVLGGNSDNGNTNSISNGNSHDSDIRGERELKLLYPCESDRCTDRSTERGADRNTEDENGHEKTTESDKNKGDTGVEGHDGDEGDDGELFVGKYSKQRSELDYSYHWQYTAQRQLFHDLLIDRFFETTVRDDDTHMICDRPRDNWLVFTAGCMGAGGTRTCHVSPCHVSLRFTLRSSLRCV